MDNCSSSYAEHKLTTALQFDSEADVWYENMPNILEQNITIPGASPLFPDAHCVASGEVCQLTLGEGGMRDSPAALLQQILMIFS